MTKPLDMSVFIDSDFDCEFMYNDKAYPRTVIGQLTEITDDGFYRCKDFGLFKYCHPRLNHWHFTYGNTMLTDGLAGQAMCTNQNVISFHTENGYTGLIVGTQGRKLLFDLHWSLNEAHPELIGQNIVAIKILRLAPGYSHPGMGLVE